MGAYVLNCRVISNSSSGTQAPGGGGIKTHVGDINIISNCFIAHNVTIGNNGGAAIYGGQLIDCVVSNNHANASSGGGVGVYQGNVIHCVIVNNSADYGGGLTMYEYNTTYASNCVIVGNTTTWRGGGIYVVAYGCIDACWISNNICTGNYGDPYRSGGGGAWLGSSAQMRNSLICKNTNTGSNARGGGVSLTGTSSNGLINCTIVDNVSPNHGGGIATYDANNIVNCIIVSNSSSLGAYPDIYNTGENSNNFWYCCANVTSAPLPSVQGNITNDPMFVDSSVGNWRLKSGSPCVNVGTNQSWMNNAYDLDSRIRIRYGTVDMGAYEAIYDGTIYGFH